MNCALWLNKRKVRSAAEIPQNPDIASLRGYLIAGSLLDWLDTNGGKDFADKLRKIPLDSPDLNDKIAEVFGVGVSIHKHFGDESHTDGNVGESATCVSGSGIGSYERFGSYGSFLEVWEEILGSAGTVSGGSYSFEERLNKAFGSASSFSFGSSGSFSFWEWFYSFFGSTSSFSFGSAGSYSFWEWFYSLFWGASSFSFGSAGSFSFWEWFYSLFWSASSFSFGSGGSFPINMVANFPFDEYDLIMLQTLYNCPLDRYGYGIHNI